MNKIQLGIVILAAGASTRMGRAKQLLKIGDRNLLQHTISNAKSIDNQELTVVLGAKHIAIRETIQKEKVNLVYNKNWASGMGTSLQCGLEFTLQKAPHLDAIIVLVCDQYFVQKSLLEALVYSYQHSQNENIKIIASHYGNNLGVPALFGKSVFSDLLELGGQYGARKLIKEMNKKGQVRGIAFPRGIYDIDTPADYEEVLKLIDRIEEE